MKYNYNIDFEVQHIILDDKARDTLYGFMYEMRKVPIDGDDSETSYNC